MEQREQIFERGFYGRGRGCVVGFDRDDRVGGIGLGSALVALAPSPAASDDQPGFVGEDNFARLRVVYFRFSERGLAFRTGGEVNRDGAL